MSATPPSLPGYEFVRALGQGGFADVFLYRQHLPYRQVAVKVLRQTTQSEADRAQFENEANRMASLTTHPYILTVYEVGVSPTGRPYLTMEYCPHDHFGKIARERPLSAARALEVGIKVAAAVETAHQSEILHRDLKPANILMTSYGEPALTDFGIAGGAEGDGLADSQGVSIPFAPPEVLNGSTSGDELSDVYSVGATVYALLAGRSPFSTGTPLSEADLMHRILSAPLPSTGREDVPASLERVLANAMARRPSKRYESAAAFGRALQAVEAELNLAQTPLQVPDSVISSPASGRAPARDDDDNTRYKAMQRVDPGGPSFTDGAPETAGAQPAAPGGPDPAAVADRVDQPRVSPTGFGGSAGSSALEARTVNRAGVAAPAVATDVVDGADEARKRRNRITASVVGGVALVAILVFVVMQASGGSGGGTDGPTTTITTPNGGTAQTLPPPPPSPPGDLAIEQGDAGGQVVTWSAPGTEDGDNFRVRFTEGPLELREAPHTTPQSEMRVETDERICVVISAIRGGRVSAESREVCSPT